MPQTISVTVDRYLTNLEAIKLSGCFVGVAWGYEGLIPFKSAEFTDMNPSYDLVVLGEVDNLISAEQFDEAVKRRTGRTPIADLHALCHAIKENPAILKEGPIVLQCQNEKREFSWITFYFKDGRGRFVVAQKSTSTGKVWVGDYRTLVPSN